MDGYRYIQGKIDRYAAIFSGQIDMWLPMQLYGNVERKTSFPEPFTC